MTAIRVWELMSKLSKCRADAEVWICTGGMFHVPLEGFEYDVDADSDEPFVNLTSDTVADPRDDA